jgi:hypothetical protein
LPGGVAMAGRRDPRDEHVVGMVDEVIAGERVNQVPIAPQVRGGDRHELTVPGRRRHAAGSSHQVVSVGSEEGGRDEDQRVVAGS